MRFKKQLQHLGNWELNFKNMKGQTKRCRCRKCGNIYKITGDNDHQCNVCKGSNTTVNGNRITGLKSIR